MQIVNYVVASPKLVMTQIILGVAVKVGNSRRLKLIFQLVQIQVFLGL